MLLAFVLALSPCQVSSLSGPQSPSLMRVEVSAPGSIDEVNAPLLAGVGDGTIVSSIDAQGAVSFSQADCTVRRGSFQLLDEDGPTMETDEKVDDSIEYAVLDGDDGVTYYIEDNEVIDALDTGDDVKLCLKEKPPPPVGDYTGPWVENGEPFYEAVSMTMMQTGESLAEERRAKLNVQPKVASKPKVMDVIAIIVDYKDHRANFEVDQVKKDLYGDSNSVRDMVEQASNGRMTLSEPTVMRVQIDKNWADYTKCSAKPWRMEAIAAAKAKGVDPAKFTYREFFIPNKPNPECGWCGIATVGCGHPSRLPNPGGCYAFYRCKGTFVRAHELGHNLGLLHAGGLSRGKFVEYGDPEAPMGASFKMSGFIAAARHQMGLLDVKPSEVIDWTPERKGPIRLSSISVPIGTDGADAVAIRWECNKCVPKVSKHAKNVGGYLWVQFRDDSGYSKMIKSDCKNKVFVHLARKMVRQTSGKGTELWATLDVGETSKQPYQDYFVHVCAIEGDIATVTMGMSEAEAKKSCSLDPDSGSTPSPPTPTPPPPSTRPPTTRRPTTKRPTTRRPTSRRPTTRRPTTRPPPTTTTKSKNEGTKHLAVIGRSSVVGKGGINRQCLPDTATKWTISQDAWKRKRRTGQKLITTRCCPIDGKGKGKTKVCLKEDGKTATCCRKGVTYEQAKEQCDKAGMKLCTAAEIWKKTPGTGCGHDFYLNWVSDTC